MRKALRITAVVFALAVGGVQLIRPERLNPPGAAARSIEQRVSVPPEVAHVLTRACKDCHSNETRWPWYSNVAPVSWFVADHVNHGRRHLNFSEWSAYTPRDAGQLLGSVCREVRQGSMPLQSYVMLHPAAKLTDADVKTLCDWSVSAGQRLAAAPAGATRQP